MRIIILKNINKNKRNIYQQWWVVKIFRVGEMRVGKMGQIIGEMGVVEIVGKMGVIQN